MYQIYTTEGIVVRVWPQKEASATISLLTKDFGLVKVHAQGVRELRSKLRYGTQELSWGKFAMVRGRDIWRLTNVLPDGNTAAWSFVSRSIFARLLKLSERLIHGEEVDERFFEIILDTKKLLAKEGVGSQLLENLEILTIVKILHCLGYISFPEDLEYVYDLQIEESTLSFSDEIKSRLLSMANQGLEASQL